MWLTRKKKRSKFSISKSLSATGFSNTWKPIMTNSIALKSITERRSGRQTCWFFLLCTNHHDLPVWNTISPQGADSAPQIDAATEEWNKLSFSAAHQSDSILLTWVKLILPGCQIWKWWRGRVWGKKKSEELHRYETKAEEGGCDL